MSDQTSAARRSISVAIVDDDAAVRVVLKRLCEMFDLTATAYASGHEFLASLEDGVPPADCLLLDAHMPTMTGAELLRDLIARGVRIPTVIFTGDDPREVSAQYTAVNVVAYLRKPLESDELLAAINRAVRSRRGES
jgi:FixJ family two-component response regulator